MPSSGYTAITFVANEQPTTAKWNLIGSNDSSFNLGTGLEDSTILARHIAANVIQAGKIDWTTAGQIWWQELGRGTLGGVAATVATPTFTARKYLMIQFTAKASGAAISPWIRFNGDTGNNYALRYGANYAGGTGLGSQNGLSLNPASINTTVSGQIFVENEAAQEKAVYISANDINTAGAANVPNIIQSNGKWANTAAQITAASLFNSSGGNFAAGTEIIVLGHD